MRGTAMSCNMTKFVQVKNMGRGGISSTEIITGGKLPDIFFDCGQQEALACADIIDLMAATNNEVVNVIIDKQFLKHIVHSHLIYLRKIQQE